MLIRGKQQSRRQYSTEKPKKTASVMHGGFLTVETTDQSLP
jgi:hypothetical protein